MMLSLNQVKKSRPAKRLHNSSLVYTIQALATSVRGHSASQSCNAPSNSGAMCHVSHTW